MRNAALCVVWVSADAGYGDKGGSVVVWLMMGVLIAMELVGQCQRVSRWPGHAALLRGGTWRINIPTGGLAPPPLHPYRSIYTNTSPYPTTIHY